DANGRLVGGFHPRVVAIHAAAQSRKVQRAGSSEMPQRLGNLTNKRAIAGVFQRVFQLARVPGRLVHHQAAVDDEENAQRGGAVTECLAYREGQGEDGDADGRGLARRGRQGKDSWPPPAGVRYPPRQPGLPGEGLAAVDSPIEGGEVIGSQGWSSRK